MIEWIECCNKVVVFELLPAQLWAPISAQYFDHVVKTPSADRRNDQNAERRLVLMAVLTAARTLPVSQTTNVTLTPICAVLPYHLEAEGS